MEDYLQLQSSDKSMRRCLTPWNGRWRDSGKESGMGEICVCVGGGVQVPENSILIAIENLN